ncbi:MAG TPA: hypothetical protein VKD72_19410, partial [Gemmataceae bacterium]|nr:hypothetical protein [Gemmataceae bacterium]
PALELRRRLEGLLARLGGEIPGPGLLQFVRALEALEHIGTPEARAVVQSLASSAGDSRLASLVQASLQRRQPGTGSPGSSSGRGVK